MSDYPKKKNIGLTQEQSDRLILAAEIRGKSPTFLMREYIDNGTRIDVDSQRDLPKK